MASRLLGAYAAVRKMRIPAAKDIPAILLLGLAGFTVYQVSLAFVEVMVRGELQGLLISAPIFTALIATVVLHERLTRVAWMGIGVSFVGVALIIWEEGMGGSARCGGHSSYCYPPSLRRCSLSFKANLQRYGAIKLTAHTIWAGTLLMLVFAPRLGTAIQRASLFATLSVIYLEILPTVLAYFVRNFALARMPASLATTLLYLLPVLAVVVAWLWLCEIPTLLSVLGGVLILLGVVADIGKDIYCVVEKSMTILALISRPYTKRKYAAPRTQADHAEEALCIQFRRSLSPYGFARTYLLKSIMALLPTYSDSRFPN